VCVCVCAVVKMAGSEMYETKTLDRVKRKLRQQAREQEVREEVRGRAGSIDTLYTGTKVRNIPEFSLRVVTRPMGPGAEFDQEPHLLNEPWDVFPTAAPPAIMDLDVEAVRGSMDQQLQLTRKPQLSSRARQRLSVKSRKKLPLSPSSLAEQGGEGARKVLSTRSVSPPASRERGSEVERVSQDQSDAGTPGPSQPQLPALSVTMSDSCEPLRPLQLTASMSAVELRPPGVLTRTRDSALSTDSGLGGEFPSRDSASLSLHVRDH
jgi:hypothetical protein